MIKVLIADNQTLTYEGLLSILSGIKGVKVIGRAVDCKDLDVLIQLKPDIIIIDHNQGDDFEVQFEQGISLNLIMRISSFYQTNRFVII
jgi:DNA-binding NarL/FixJ family response regulator